MTTYGIVIEGNYDEAALIELIKKCLSENIEVMALCCGGKDRLMNKFPVYLDSFRYANKGHNVDKALVVRDADGKDPNELLARMKDNIAGRKYLFEVKFVIIVQALETWLLADEEAISRVTRPRSGRTVSGVNEDLETIIRPKDRLEQMLSEARVAYTDKVAKEIARESDVSRIEYRCPKFGEFRQAVIDC